MGVVSPPVGEQLLAKGGNCKYYDSYECYCEARCEFDLCEQDTCDNWEDDNEDEFIDENVRLKLTRGRI